MKFNVGDITRTIQGNTIVVGEIVSIEPFRVKVLESRGQPFNIGDIVGSYDTKYNCDIEYWKEHYEIDKEYLKIKQFNKELEEIINEIS